MAAVAMCVPLLVGCGGKNETESTGPVTITFWHSMASANGEAVQHIVDEYNSKNSGKIHVESVYQGKYGDTVNKLVAAIKAKKTPNLVQVYEIGTKLMIDTKATVPFADLAQSAGYSMDDIEPGAARYYSVNGKLQSLPFNASAPMIYYNKTAFKEAGLDPDKPPTTFEELRAAAEKLTVRSGNAVSRYGMVASIDGWLVEQMLANGDVTYCDKDNGRSGTATTVTWDNETLKGIVNTWAGLIRDGYGLNVGRNNTDASAAFQSGRAAILPFTSANMRDITKGSKFDVGVANFIKPVAGAGGGVFNGGASVWTMAGHPKREQEAAFDFLRHLGSPETQAYWAAQTGYIPLNVKAVDAPAFKEVLSTYPDFAKPAKQLGEAATSAASRGCLMGAMPQARNKMNDVLESVILGKATPEKAIADAQAEVNSAIQAYNKSIEQ